MAGSEDAVLATGLFDGINKAVGIMRDDKANRERKERDDVLYQQKQTAYDQGQQDRTHALQRRGIEEGRADAKFNQTESDSLRMQKSQNALNNFMVRGDLDGTNAFLDEYSPDGMKPNLVQRDGKYFSEGPDQSGNVISKEMSQKDIGKLLMRMGKQDVFGDYQKGLDADAAVNATKGDRAHDLDKIDRRNKGALDVAKLRLREAALIRKDKKAGGKAGAAGKIPEYSKQNAKLAANYYGGKFENGVFSFGSDGDELKAASATALADLMYTGQPDDTRNINVEFRKATMLVERASEEANAIAKNEAEAGSLGNMEEKDRAAQIFESIMNQSVEKFTSKRALSIPKASNSPAIERNSKGSSAGAKPITEKEYFDSLRANPKFKDRTDGQIKSRVSDMKKKFPERFKTTSIDPAERNRNGYLGRKKKRAVA